MTKTCETRNSNFPFKNASEGGISRGPADPLKKQQRCVREQSLHGLGYRTRVVNVIWGRMLDEKSTAPIGTTRRSLPLGWTTVRPVVFAFTEGGLYFFLFRRNPNWPIVICRCDLDDQRIVRPTLTAVSKDRLRRDC